jgi:hypothetical protein
MNLGLTKGISESVHDSSLSATDSSDNHESVTHKGGFIKLNDLDEPVLYFLKVVFFQESSDSSFNILVDFLWDSVLLWENILK